MKPSWLPSSLSLRNKILILTVGLIVVLIGVTLVVVNSQVRSQALEKIETEFLLTQQTFNRFLWLRNGRLIESCLLISELPVLKAQLSTNDPATIKDYVLNLEESPAKIVEVDIFTLTNEKGVVLFRLDRPEIFGDTVSSLPFVAQALQGVDPDDDEVLTWVNDEKLYQITTFPIFQRRYVIGSLTLGKRLTQEEADILKIDTRSEITFILGNRIVASTHGDVAQVDLLRAFLVDRNSIMTEIEQNQNAQREVLLNGERFLCAFAPISRSSDAMYVMATSLDAELASLNLLQQVITGVGVFALVVALMGGYALARGITAPVQRLVEATERIRSGDFDFQLRSTAKDEIGRLARSFDEMVMGLKERTLMSKFISASTVEMIRQEGRLQLGGERRNVTVFFSDIRNFTSFSERVQPEVVIEILNKYLSVQAKIVIRRNGIIDKYVGDELVAIFEGAEMADNAVLAAIEIQQAIDVLNKDTPEDIRIGIGINTGMAIVGNVGSDERMDHTVLGNNMNLGSRLSEIAQAGQIIISESTWRLLTQKAIKARALDPITVKGISRPVQIYEVIADGESTNHDAT